MQNSIQRFICCFLHCQGARVCQDMSAVASCTAWFNNGDLWSLPTLFRFSHIARGICWKIHLNRNVSPSHTHTCTPPPLTHTHTLTPLLSPGVEVRGAFCHAARCMLEVKWPFQLHLNSWSCCDLFFFSLSQQSSYSRPYVGYQDYFNCCQILTEIFPL